MKKDETCAFETHRHDVVIVGAGFSGMYLLHLIRQLGLSVVVVDMASDIGGTWYWNRYPGARCDIESIEYSYSFDDDLQQEWEWSERYSAQGEILAYANHVAERFDLRRDMRFNTRIVAASYDDGDSVWTLQSEDGEVFRCKYAIFALGCLSVPRRPAFSGLDSFSGRWYHTGLWPHEEVDFSGLRVGVIGTGSSAIQSIPQIARQAQHLTVFQRTANFSVPAWNAPLDPEDVSDVKRNYQSLRERSRWSFSGVRNDDATQSGLEVSRSKRHSELERRWSEGGFALLNVFTDVNTDINVNRYAADFVHEKIRDKVHDRSVAELLCPRNHPFGTKRLCVDIDYYETYNRENVSLVDISNNPIARITPVGLETRSGTAYTFDALVFATGFDAMTGPLLSIDVRGSAGQSLKEKWQHGPRTYLGLTVAGFPNMFTITGPQSPSVLTNMMMAIEQHVEWVVDCISFLENNGIDRIDAREDAENAWVDHNEEVGNQTLYPLASSWYVGANIPGKPRVFMPYTGGLDAYRRKCDKVAAEGYSGFVLHKRAI